MRLSIKLAYLLLALAGIVLMFSNTPRASVALVGTPPTPQTDTLCSNGTLVFPSISVTNTSALTVEFLCSSSGPFGCFAGATITDDNGGVWSALEFDTDTNPGVSAGLYYSLNHASGATVVTVHFTQSSAGSCSQVAYVQEWSGVRTGGAANVTASSSGTGTSIAPSVTTTNTGVVIGAGVQKDSAAAISAGPTNAFTEFADPTNPNVTIPMAAYKIVGAGSSSTTWTAPNSGHYAWAIGGLAEASFTPTPTTSATPSQTATPTTSATATTQPTLTPTTSPTPTISPTASRTATATPTPLPTVTVNGCIYDFFAKPVVGVPVSINPLKATPPSGNAIVPNPVATNTDINGCFSLQTLGGMYAAFYAAGSDTMPAAIVKGTLPDSGTISYSSLLSNGTIAAFPPTGNLDMDSNTFTSVAGATLRGEPVVEGSGLAGGRLFTSSGTFTAPANATWIIATVLGAGGGGGGGANGGKHGGGGGGGGELTQCLMLPSGGVVTVAVGNAGHAGTAGVDGTAGGDSSVKQNGGTTICTATGGSLGTHAFTGGNGTGGAGGSGGLKAGSRMDLFDQAGDAGANGTNPIGGDGAGLGFFGGTGGAPHGQSGSAGLAGMVLIRAF